jgi:hypothetical protein
MVELNNNNHVSKTKKAHKNIKCEMCKALRESNDYNNVEPPKYSQSFIDEVDKKLLKFDKTISSPKYKLGVIKFSHNNKNYIHCPIKKVENNLIKFGICENFQSLENTAFNRQSLSIHKYRYHFNCDSEKSKILNLKVSKSIEDVLFDHSSD